MILSGRNKDYRLKRGGFSTPRSDIEVRVLPKKLSPDLVKQIAINRQKHATASNAVFNVNFCNKYFKTRNFER